MTKYEIKLYAKDKKTISRFLKFFNQSQNQIKHFPIALNFKRKKDLILDTHTPFFSPPIQIAKGRPTQIYSKWVRGLLISHMTKILK